MCNAINPHTHIHAVNFEYVYRVQLKLVEEREKRQSKYQIKINK